MPILLNTLASVDQIENTPSRKDGIPSELEDELRVYGCQLIQQAGILLKLPQVAMATAQVLFQRFWYVTSMKHFSIKDIGAGALFLASKLEESPLSIRDLVNVYDYLIQRSLHASKHNPGPRALERRGLSKPQDSIGDGNETNSSSNSNLNGKRKQSNNGKGKEDDHDDYDSNKRHQSSHPSESSTKEHSANHSFPSSIKSNSSRESIPTFKYVAQSYFAQSFYDAKDALVIAEMQILKRLGFNVQVNLPYATMVNYLQLLGLTNSEEYPGVAQRAWGYLNDALQTPVYCLFPPHILACASIYLCTLQRQTPLIPSSTSNSTAASFKPPSLPMKPEPWYILFDATRSELRSVCAHLLRLYDDEFGLAARVREEWGGLADLADKKGVKEWLDRWGKKEKEK